MNAPRSFAFGPFQLIPERQLLLRENAPVRIGCRALDLLTALVERPGELVTKGELMTRVWPHTVVAEANLKVNISTLRRALDEAVDAPNYIATVNGRGYRFVAPVRTGPSLMPSQVSASEGTRIHLIATSKHGVWLVDLSTLQDPALVATAIATAIGVTTHAPKALDPL